VGFVFNATDQDDYDYLKLHHAKTSPRGREVDDGKADINVSADRWDPNMPSVSANDILWYRVTCDGTTVKVRAIVDNSDEPNSTEWSNASDCFSSSELDIAGGMIGFVANNAAVSVDNLSVYRRRKRGLARRRAKP